MSHNKSPSAPLKSSSGVIEANQMLHSRQIEGFQLNILCLRLKREQHALGTVLALGVLITMLPLDHVLPNHFTFHN